MRGDTFIYYRKLREGANPAQVSVVPDVYVAVGDLHVPLSSYKIWKVGLVPQFVMEVRSHLTHHRERDEKYAIYERLGFREYWWFDPIGTVQRSEDAGRTLLGWWPGERGRYEPLAFESGVCWAAMFWD